MKIFFTQKLLHKRSSQVLAEAGEEAQSSALESRFLITTSRARGLRRGEVKDTGCWRLVVTGREERVRRLSSTPLCLPSEPLRLCCPMQSPHKVKFSLYLG